jgi:hypothetical protein
MLQPVGYTNYTTAAGESFDIIALSMYDEESMSSYIIAANPDYSDVLIFEGSARLKIPVFERRETTDSLAPWRRST